MPRAAAAALIVEDLLLRAPVPVVLLGEQRAAAALVLAAAAPQIVVTAAAAADLVDKLAELAAPASAFCGINSKAPLLLRPPTTVPAPASMAHLLMALRPPSAKPAKPSTSMVRINTPIWAMSSMSPMAALSPSPA